MQSCEAGTWAKLSMVVTLSCATVSLDEMVPPNAVSENTEKIVQKIVSSRPTVVAGARSPNPKVLRLTNA